MFQSTNKKTLLLFASVLILCIAFLEISLRVFKTDYYTYTEKIGYGYTSPYDVGGQSWYFSYPPNTVLERKQVEFSYNYNINKLGIPAPDIKDIEKSKYKILCLGDSFTEGVGAPQDSSWPGILQKKLDYAYPDSFSVINGGIGGSDIIYIIKLYDSVLYKYEPDEVIILVNSSDLADIFFRNGENRFLEDGTVKYKDKPWFESFFRYSFLVRSIVLDLCNFNFNLVGQKPYESEIKNACGVIENSLKKLYKKDLKIQVYIQPVPHELKTKKYAHECFGNIPINLKHVKDILGEYNQLYSLETHELDKMYWPIDGHFNASGYNLIAEIISKPYLEN